MISKEKRGTWSFVQNLLMALLSVTLLFIIGFTFLSFFVPQEIDAGERIRVIENALSKTIGPDDVEYSFFQLNQGEFMIIYKYGFTDGCGSSEWPELEDNNHIGICTGLIDSEPRHLGAFCESFRLEPEFPEGANINENLRIILRGSFGGAPAMARLGIQIIGHDPRGSLKAGYTGFCIIPKEKTTSYRMEYSQSTFVQREEYSVALIRLEG